MKNLFIIALSAGALYLLYTAYKNNQEQKPKVASPNNADAETPAEPQFACPEGEILCESKEKTCFNPAAKYIVHPCS
jgi:uncharacterized membrane protein YebE (DUF533 family)